MIDDPIKKMDACVQCLYIQLPKDVADDVFGHWIRAKAVLVEKDAEITKLQHELKQDEYKFIRNHDSYHKELCELRTQLTEKDAEIERLNASYDADMKAWVWKIEQLSAELDRVVGEAFEAMQLLRDHQNGCPLPSYEEGWNEAMQKVQAFLNSPIVQSWRARQGKETA